MRSIQILAFALLLTSSNWAQTVKSTNNPLPNDAFDQMIVQDITYAIVGENTPVSGIKVDVSKPDATISGVFTSRKTPWSLFGFEFKGGVIDRNFSILKGFNNFNTAFELKPSFHFIPYGSSAKYGTPDVAEPNKLIVHAKNRLVEKKAASLRDSAYVIARIYNYHLSSIKTAENLPQGITSINERHENIAIYFIKKIMKDEDLNVAETASLDEIIKLLPQASVENGSIKAGTYYDEIAQLYKKYKKLYDNLKVETMNRIISNASEIWTRKKYFWWTFSPFGRTEKVNEYYTKYQDKDSSYFKSDFRLYYGASVVLNWYFVYPYRNWAQLIRLGGSLSRSNNLSTLSSFNYETRSAFFSSGTSTTEKTKSGIAYNHSEIKTGMVSQLSLEYYLLPLNSLVPGVYLSPSLNYSELYQLSNIKDRDNDKTQASLEGGLVFNINSREKDKEKTILSLLAYFRHEDLTDKRRTSVQTGLEESRDDFRKRNFSIGIRVGIPINLPQRSK